MPIYIDQWYLFILFTYLFALFFISVPFSFIPSLYILGFIYWNGKEQLYSHLFQVHLSRSLLPFFPLYFGCYTTVFVGGMKQFHICEHLQFFYSRPWTCFSFPGPIWYNLLLFSKMGFFSLFEFWYLIKMGLSSLFSFCLFYWNYF